MTAPRSPTQFWALLVSAFMFGIVATWAFGQIFVSSAGLPDSRQSGPSGVAGNTIAIALVLTGLLTAATLLVLRYGFAGRSLATGANSPKTAELVGLELGKVLATIRSRIETHDSYAKSLGAAQDRLNDLPSEEQIRVIVTLLLAENHRMRLDTETMSKELEASRQRIDKLHSSLQKATEVGLRDPLTSVGNRRCFDIKLADAISTTEQSKAPLAIILGDIDMFKKVNDDFGHQIGDEVLKYFAQLLQSNVRDHDTVARFGGEEFAIILPGSDNKSAAQVAERIREQLVSKHLTIRKTSQEIGMVTASFGVTQLQAGETAKSLVSRADAKLYEAKKTGRNRVITG